MTNHRRQSAKRQFAQDGSPLCSCGCGRPPGKGRRSWHSQECVDGWLERNDPGRARQAVFRRDKGVCAICGRNAEAAERRFRRTLHPMRGIDPFNGRYPRGYPHGPGSVGLFLAWRQKAAGRRIMAERGAEQRRARLKADGWPLHIRTSWWEADHIVPVSEGGGQCGLDNLRTLCWSCHRAETRKLAARLAARRNKEKALLGLTSPRLIWRKKEKV